MHPVAASQSKLCELSLMFLTKGSETMAIEGSRGCREEEESTLTGGCLSNASIRGCSAHTREETRRSNQPEARGGGRSRGVEPPRSPREGGAWRFHSEVLVEVAGAHDSPKVAPARVIGAGRHRRATTAAIQSPERRRG
jgi:hypothetical protein